MGFLKCEVGYFLLDSSRKVYAFNTYGSFLPDLIVLLIRPTFRAPQLLLLYNLVDDNSKHIVMFPVNIYERLCDSYFLDGTLMCNTFLVMQTGSLILFVYEDSYMTYIGLSISQT